MLNTQIIEMVHRTATLSHLPSSRVNPLAIAVGVYLVCLPFATDNNANCCLLNRVHVYCLCQTQTHIHTHMTADVTLYTAADAVVSAAIKCICKCSVVDHFATEFVIKYCIYIFVYIPLSLLVMKQ